ncbi:MAG: Sua5/YciO/YrdC/YwlC family protein [Spiroplasma sp.]|nr:Sua5/YciO/YrdC/YwlC family protein [Mycoplasmatales bacterium]
MIIDEKEAIELLLAGEIIGIPTDTVYGLACLESYEDKIYKVKKRDANKKLITIIDDISFFKNIDPNIITLMEKLWPGDTTIVFDYQGSSSGFRIADEPNLLSLLYNLKLPIKTTSANVSSLKPCTTKEEFIIKFPNIPLLEEKQIKHKSCKPSKIIVYNNSKIKKIR